MKCVRIFSVISLIVLGTIIEQSLLNAHQLHWADTISKETAQDSWKTWDTFYRKDVKPDIDEEKFFCAVNTGSYKMISVDEFLNLPIENHRLYLYKNAQAAQEAYPEHDHPRGMKDIESVEYHLTTNNDISPISIAQMTDHMGKKRLIKLDGVHRLVAAAISKSPIKVLFINLDRA